MKKSWILIGLNIVPIIIMIGLIRFVFDDLLLTAIYCILIGISFAIKEYKKDIVVFVFGFFIMIISECFFIQTRVETFQRTSLLGIMPLWLPFLWGYGFVVIKRVTLLLLVQVDSRANFAYTKYMEENYIQIFCNYVADMLEQNKLTEEDMGILIQEFAKVAEHVHSRQDLIKFLHDFRDYPELAPLKSQLENQSHVFTFKEE